MAKLDDISDDLDIGTTKLQKINFNISTGDVLNKYTLDKIDKLATKMAYTAIEQIAFDAASKLNYKDYGQVTQITAPDEINSQLPVSITKLVAFLLAWYDNKENLFVIKNIDGRPEPYLGGILKDDLNKGQVYKMPTLYNKHDIEMLILVNRIFLSSLIAMDKKIDLNVVLLKKSGLKDMVASLKPARLREMAATYTEQLGLFLRKKSGVIDSADSIEFLSATQDNLNVVDSAINLLTSQESRILGIPQSILYGLRATGISANNATDLERYNILLDNINNNYTKIVLTKLGQQPVERVDTEKLNKLNDFAALAAATADNPLMAAQCQKYFEQWSAE